MKHLDRWPATMISAAQWLALPLVLLLFLQSPDWRWLLWASVVFWATASAADWNDA